MQRSLLQNLGRSIGPHPLLFSTLWAMLFPWRIPFPTFVRRLHETLWGTAFLMAVSIAFVGGAMCDQAAIQAKRLLGDLSFVGSEYIVLGFEEYGPIIVAVAFASRVGAGFAAEVAMLSSNETLDALVVMGTDPARERLAPMGWASGFGCVCLGLLSLVVWELAGLLLISLRHGVNIFTFFRPDSIALHSLVLCVVKNGSFGLLVFIASLDAGLRARGGAEEVGIAVTRAVVNGLVMCLALNLAIDIVWYAIRGPA